MTVTGLPPDLHLPDYVGACLTNVVPQLLRAPGTRDAAWLPDPVRDAEQVVLLVLDGLGWLQLRERTHLAPTLASMTGGPLTSVAPTTTATALSSIVQGSPPSTHGVVGYRMRVDGPPCDGGEEPAELVLNVLRWRTSLGDARDLVPAAEFQPTPAFDGRDVPVVTKAEFASTGFTTAQGLDRLRGWHAASSIAVETGAALRNGAPFVYAYYEGVDKVAHGHGFGAHYDAELVATDRLVADVVAALPSGAALVVTADHGQVEVGDRTIPFAADVVAETRLLSGEGRFAWLHAATGPPRRPPRPLPPALRGAGPGPRGHPRRDRRRGLVRRTAARRGGGAPGRRRRRGAPARGLPRPVRHGLGRAPVPARFADRGRAVGAVGGRRIAGLMSDADVPVLLSPETVEAPGETERVESPTEAIQHPAKVMRIGSMIKQLLEEVRRGALDEAGRARLAEIYGNSVEELSASVSPDLRDELGRLVGPFLEHADGAPPSEAELRIAQAQLVGWLEGLFQGIQAALFAQQLEARQQLEELRQRSLPAAGAEPGRPGTYL